MVPVSDVDPNTILDIVSKEGLVAREGLTAESRLADLDIPSLEMISILFAVEDRYGVTVETDELAKATTIQDLLDLVTARLQAPTRSR
jgi:acyl carrier protein